MAVSKAPSSRAWSSTAIMSSRSARISVRTRSVWQRPLECGGRVDAFEPQRACYALLQAQIALNRLHNIHAHCKAVGRSAGRLWVPAVNYADYGNFGGVALSSDQAPTSEPVDVVTLDEQIGDRPCALLKIDVEGMEEDVIRGATALIEKSRPLLYVENDRVDKSKSLVALLLGLGYRLWWHIPKLYNPNNFFDVKDNVYGETASFNMFGSRESHPAAAGLVEIRSPDDPHPLAPKPVRDGIAIHDQKLAGDHDARWNRQCRVFAERDQPWRLLAEHLPRGQGRSAVRAQPQFVFPDHRPRLDRPDRQRDADGLARHSRSARGYPARTHARLSFPHSPG